MKVGVGAAFGFWFNVIFLDLYVCFYYYFYLFQFGLSIIRKVIGGLQSEEVDLQWSEAEGVGNGPKLFECEVTVRKCY